MEEIRKYVEEFFATTRATGDCKLKGSQITSFFIEMGDFDAGKMIEGINYIFEYGYAKGYRAAMDETQKGGKL